MSIDRERVFFEASPTAMLLLSPDGTISRANPGAAKTLGTAMDRLGGRPILGMVLEDDRDRVKDFFLRVLQGQQREWTTRFRRGDGATRVQWVRAVPVENDGQVRAILMFIRDVTESREGRPETVQLQTLLENLPGQFTVVVDRQGRIRYSSGLTRSHFLSDVELVGSPYEELLSDDPEPPDMSAMLDAAKAGDHWAGLHWHRRVDGIAFPVQVFACPYQDPRTGRVLGALVAGRDASSEYQWRTRAQKAQAFAGIGEIVAEVAEELAVGLAGIQRSLAAGDGQVDEADVRRMLEVANSLGDFSGLQDFEGRPVLLGDVAMRAVQEVDGDLESIASRVDIDEPDGPVTVHGDARLLVLLVEELLKNALETLDADDPDAKVEITVGAGASGGTIHVVNPHSTGEDGALHCGFDALYSTKEGQAGLGLTLARAVAQAHGGRVWSDQAADGRIRFSVLLPSDPGESKVRFRPKPLALTRTITVLVVDDEEEVRTGIRKFLEKVGFEVREAWSGRSALAQITAGRPPELVLTDLKMSDGSGQWFLNQLSRDFPDLLRRTVIITGDPDQGGGTRVLGETTCPVVTKPIELPELLELIDEVAVRH